MYAATKRVLLESTVERLGRSSIKRRNSFIDMVRLAADIEGIECVFQRIIERDDEMAIDHLMEISYGIRFKHLGFITQFEPTGSQGPDLLVERGGVRAFVEVKRYRPKETEQIPKSLGPYGTLQTYGNPEYTQNRIANDLLDKLRQIEPRDGVEHGILAIWSDRDCFEDDAFDCAVRQMSSEASKKGLRFCIYGSDWRSLDPSDQRRLYCTPLGSFAIFDSWMKDIETS
jgi:hypothetical protein